MHLGDAFGADFEIDSAGGIDEYSVAAAGDDEGDIFVGEFGVGAAVFVVDGDTLAVFNDGAETLAEAVDAFADAEAEPLHEPGGARDIRGGGAGHLSERAGFAAGDGDAAVFKFEGPFCFADAEREFSTVEYEFVFEIVDADVGGGEGVVQFGLYVFYFIGPMVHDADADHIRHGGGDVELEDEALEFVGGVYFLAIDSGDP